jgi:hypothetical protein
MGDTIETRGRGWLVLEFIHPNDCPESDLATL